MLDEFRFAVKCGASRQRPVLRRSCSNCSLSKSGKTVLPISRIHEFNSPTTANFLPHSKLSNLNSLSNGNLRLISSNENAGSFPSHLHHSHQFLHQPHHYAPHAVPPPPLLHHQLLHQNSNLSSSNHQIYPYRSHGKLANFKNYKLASFNNQPDSYCRPLNSDLYGLPLMPYSLQNLLLLDPTGAHHHQADESGAFNNGDSSNIPTPPLPPDPTHRLLNQSSVSELAGGQSNLKPTLVKQRSLAAIDLDQYADAHFQHHLETLAHQFNQQSHGSSRQLETGNPHLHRTLSNDNFDKCNLMDTTADENHNAELIGPPDGLLFGASPGYDLDGRMDGRMEYRTEDNQPGN